MCVLHSGRGTKVSVYLLVQCIDFEKLSRCYNVSVKLQPTVSRGLKGLVCVDGGGGVERPVMADILSPCRAVWLCFCIACISPLLEVRQVLIQGNITEHCEVTL